MRTGWTRAAAAVLGWLASALVGTAAEPLPSLDDLLAQYRTLGLPTPSKEAKLVRFEWPGDGTGNGKAPPKRFGVAFLVKPGTEKEPPVLLTAAEEWRPHWNPPLVEVKPGPAALENLTLSASDQLVMAIHCHGRGWDELARPLLEASQRDANLPRDVRPPQPPGGAWMLEEGEPAGRGTARQQLFELAWMHWAIQSTEPKADRAALSRRLKELLRQDPRLDSDLNRALLAALDFGLTPDTAKPGSIEALITGLVDYTGPTGNITGFDRDDCYWRVANLGFDAVPALIEHLDDERLTVAIRHGFNNFRSRRMHVGDVAGDILEGIAGLDIEGAWARGFPGHRADEAAAIRWWDQVRSVREETYLMEHVLPRHVKKGEKGLISEHHLHVLVAKYPRRVLDVYRTVLDKRPEVDSEMLSQALLRCELPARLKLEQLSSAIRSKENGHRVPALEALRDLDKQEFARSAIAIIDSLPRDTAGRYDECIEGRIARIAFDSDDPRVRETLQRVAARSTVGLRMELLNCRCPYLVTHRRRELLQYLVSFLDDDTVRDTDASIRFGGRCAGHAHSRLEVRNFVALELAAMVEVETEANLSPTSDLWANLRSSVRKAVARELNKPKERTVDQA